MVLSRVDESTQIDSKNDRSVDTDRDWKIFWKVSDFKKFRLLEIFFYFVSNKNKHAVILFFFQQKYLTDFWGLIRCWNRHNCSKVLNSTWILGIQIIVFESIQVHSSILVITIQFAVNFYIGIGGFRVFDNSIPIFQKWWDRIGVGL